MSEQTYTGYGNVGEVTEKDSATVDGTDVSGRWNRMIEDRSVSEYPGPDGDLQSSLERFAPDRVGRCIQCGKCTSVCTVNDIDKDYNPRYWVQLARTGRTEELLQNRDEVWKCVSCFKCTNFCPKDVEPEKVMKALGNWLEEETGEKRGPHVFDEEFWEEVRETGHIEEGHLLKNFFEKTDQDLVSDWTEEIGKRMTKRLPLTQLITMGKNFVFTPETEGWDEVREVLDEYLEEQEEKYER